MLTSPNIAATNIVGADNKKIEFLFTVIDTNPTTHYWSFIDVVVVNTYESKVIESSPINLNRTNSENGILGPSGLTFKISNPDNTLLWSDFIDGTVKIEIQMYDSSNNFTARTNRFIIRDCLPGYQTLTFICEDFIQQYLRGSYPNTKLVKDIFPSTDIEIDDNLCIPEPYGVAYIPLRSVAIPDSTTLTNNTISFVASTSGEYAQVNDSNSGLGIFSKNSFVTISGASNSENNGTFFVFTSADGRLELHASSGIVAESAFETVTIEQTERFYVLGDTANTYKIDKVHSPRESGKKSEWQDLDWTVSGSGVSEYYAVSKHGGNPYLDEPKDAYGLPRLLLNNAVADKATLGSLSAGEWGYGNNDSLGYDTVYVRTSGSADPDGLADNYVSIDNVFTQYTKADEDANDWRIFQPIIGISSIGSAADENGLWRPDSQFLDMPTKFSRSDTLSMTNPADIIEQVLKNMGVPSANIDSPSFTAAASIFDGYSVALEFNGAFWFKQERRSALSILLNMCNSILVSEDKIELHVLSKASRKEFSRGYDLTSAVYDWTSSGSGTDEYYCVLNAGGGDPSLIEPSTCRLLGLSATRATVGSLAVGEWGYGDNDTLGYSTVYVRLSDGTDPDTKYTGYVSIPSDVIKNADVGIGTFKYNNITSKNFDDAGYFLWQAVDEPQDRFIKKIMPIGGVASEISAITLDLPFMNDSRDAQQAAKLVLNRKLGKVVRVSLDAKLSCIFMQPGDVVSINADDYGGSYDVIIDSVSIDRKKIKFSFSKYSNAFADWDDISPSILSVTPDNERTAWEYVQVGTDGQPGNSQNSIPGAFRVGFEDNYLFMDPSIPALSVYEGSQLRFRSGKLATDEYGIAAYKQNGELVMEINSTHAKIAGWDLDTNVLSATSGAVGLSSAVTGGDDIRIWAGHATPSSAPFYVTEAGVLVASSGTIGGWVMDSTSIAADSGSFTLNSSTPALLQGNATDYLTGTGVFMGKHSGVYKLHMGNPAGDHMYFDGTNLFVSGVILTGADISGTTANAFTVNSDLTDANIQLILGRTTGGNATFQWNGTTGDWDKPFNFAAAVTFASTISAANIGADTDNTVVILNGSGLLKTDEIDPRVWGFSLVDGSGSSTRLGIWSDANTLSSNVNLTWAGTTLTVSGTLAATTVTGANVTTGEDPGHTHTGTSLSSIDHDTDLINVSPDDHHAQTHTIVSHDTTATGANLTSLTNNSIVNTLHRHSELVASDGSPDPALSIDSAGNVGIGTASPGANLHVLATSEQLRLGFDVSNYASFIVGSGGNLTVAPTGDFIFNPTGNDILPTTNYDLNIGSLSKKYLTLHAAELWVETLVAQDTIATIGGRILVGPTTVLTSDLTNVATTILVKHNQMASGDRVYMEANGKVEFMSIDSAPGGVGPYSYTVTRNLDGTGANVWNAGDAVFNTGTTGDGFIDLYSFSGLASGTTGPTIVGNVRNSSTYNDWTEHWAIGNLDGLYGYGSTTYGAAFGAYSEEAYITIDSSNGVRFFDSADAIQAQLTGTTWTMGVTSTEHINITSTAIQLKDGATVYTSLSGGTLTLGLTSAEHVSITSSGVDLKDNTTIYARFAATTTIGATGTEHVSITSSTMQFKDGATINGSLSGNIWTLGQTGAEHVLINTSGMTIKDNATILANFGVTVTIGEVGASKGNVHISSGAIELRVNTTPTITLGTDGILTLHAGKDLVVEAGGDIVMQGGSTNPSLLRFNDLGTKPGEIRFERSADANAYWSISKEVANDALIIKAFGSAAGGFIGFGTDNPAEEMHLYGSVQAGMIIEGAGGDSTLTLKTINGSQSILSFATSTSGAVGALTFTHSATSNLRSLVIEGGGSTINMKNNSVGIGVVPDGSYTLDVAGDIHTSFDLSADGTFVVSGLAIFETTVNAANIGADTDNTVVVLNGSGLLKTDEIDSRVWGSSLVDGSGASGKVAYWSDGNTLTNTTLFNFNGTSLGIGGTPAGSVLHVQTSSELTSGHLFLRNTHTENKDLNFHVGAKATGSFPFTIDHTVNTIQSSGTAAMHLAFATGNDERMRLQNTTGNLGIGTDNPLDKLDVKGASPFVRISNSAETKSGIIFTDSNDPTNQNLQMVYDAGNNDFYMINDFAGETTVLQIGQGGETFMLPVYSDTISSNVRDLQIDDSGQLGYVTSTKQAKIYVEQLRKAPWIYELNPVSYERRKTIKEKNKELYPINETIYLNEGNGVQEAGLIAEDVEKIRPELVYHDGNIPVGVDYKGLIVPILTEVQSIDQRVHFLESENFELRLEIKNLKAA